MLVLLSARLNSSKLQDETDDEAEQERHADRLDTDSGDRSSDGDDSGSDLADFVEQISLDERPPPAAPFRDDRPDSELLLEQLNDAVGDAIIEARKARLSREDLAYFHKHLIVTPIKIYLAKRDILKPPVLDDFFDYIGDQGFERDPATGKIIETRTTDSAGLTSVTYTPILRLPVDSNYGIVSGVPIHDWNARFYALGVAYHAWHVNYFWPKDAEPFADLDKEEQLAIFDRDIKICHSNVHLKRHVENLFMARSVERAHAVAVRDANRNQKAVAAVKVQDPLLVAAIHRHTLALQEMASVSSYSADVSAGHASFSERDRKIFAKYPYIAPGNIWGLDGRTFKPSRQEPPARMRPGEISAAMKKAIKEACDNHLYALMQHTGSQWVSITVEYERDPRDINRDHDARLLAERREAFRRMVFRHARELGIIMVVAGAELHGGTREKGTTEREQTKFAKKRKKTINRKKRNLNPKGGGDKELSESEEVDEAEREENADLEARETANADAKADRAREERLKLLTQRALDRIRGQTPKDRIANENARANGEADPKPVDSIGVALELKIDELRRSKMDLDIGTASETKATTAYQLAVIMETIRGMLNELRAERDAKGSTLAQEKVYKLARLEQAFSQLKKSLPNSRINLFHEHFSALIKETQSRAFDPDRLGRMMEAPLVLECQRDPKGALFCERCGDRYATDTVCKRAPSASPTMKCTPCAACTYCERRLPLDYYENTKEWTLNSPELIKALELRYGGGVFPSGSLDLGALLFSEAHAGGLAYQSVRVNCNMNRTKYVSRRVTKLSRARPNSGARASATAFCLHFRVLSTPIM